MLQKTNTIVLLPTLMARFLPILSLAANVIVFAIIIKRSLALKKNPYKEEIFVGTKDYDLAMDRAE